MKKYFKEHFPQSWRVLRRVRNALVRLSIRVIRSRQADNAFPTFREISQWGD